MREYNALIKEALDIGIKSPETYYYEGKIKGKANRDRGVVGHKVQKEGEIVSGNIPSKENEDAIKAKKETKSYKLLKKPDFNRIPYLVKKISMIEFPQFLGGFKLFNRK
ncbi:MAG: hypothetical protein O8C63_07315 [Candidatus Methanoperedens sp.]|nr:hypothetical protein [Candidatus Methanoperedens sp.]